MPIKALITLIIVLALGCGVGALVFGIMWSRFGPHNELVPTFVAIGSALLSAGVAALVAHLHGGFKDFYRDDASHRDYP